MEFYKNDMLSKEVNSLADSILNIESILRMTQENCLNKEINLNYYNLLSEEKIFLSQERNDYINMLNLALDEVVSLKKYCNNIENYLE